ncbi:TMEM175 family protein [Salinibacterium sp. ZJ454]|uniref:TMEM175 family protein n=1 Tax=Salinibacterium sp. ZJ454 TaxID=2708339 RepID=UPI00142440F8|nr:TMEM175 family protein [Salinibacterium sp. ZJ454]
MTDDNRAGRDGVLARKTSEFDRGLGFYDAIYAVAITLLIVNVDVPEPDAWHDLSSLAASGLFYQLAGFALSFLVIAVFWRVNVRLVQLLSALDPATTTANLVAVALVVLVPFTTQGISDPETAGFALPTVFYAVNLAAVSVAQTLMFQIARRKGLEIRPRGRRENRILLIDALTTPLVFLASVPVALLWGADAGKLSWASLLLIGPLSGRLAIRAIQSGP